MFSIISGLPVDRQSSMMMIHLRRMVCEQTVALQCFNHESDDTKLRLTNDDMLLTPQRNLLYCVNTSLFHPGSWSVWRTWRGVSRSFCGQVLNAEWWRTTGTQPWHFVLLAHTGIDLHPRVYASSAGPPGDVHHTLWLTQCFEPCSVKVLSARLCIIA
jgi:hypothetical protein